jgi:radical SAM superfamily enzyme YgiQ (UPF0313 family)
MKVLVIETVWIGHGRYGFFDKTLLTAFSILPTLQARQLAAVTPRQHMVRVVNERYEPVDVHGAYDVVLINYTTPTAPRAYELADAFRARHIPVVLSGIHASAVPEEAKEHADAVLLGRGEPVWPAVLEDIEHHRLKSFYEPVSFQTSPSLPETRVELPGFVLTGAVEATRGCPYQCDFCPETHLSNRQPFFKRPVEDVVREVRGIPQRTVMFYDGTLTTDGEYARELFVHLRGTRKRFLFNGNVDMLAGDPELVRLSRQAGGLAWFVGFESVSKSSLESYHKRTNRVDEYKRAVENIHANRMAAFGSFMFGADTETPEIFSQTLRIVDDLGLDVVDFCILTPLPGTPLFQRLDAEHRILTKDWSCYTLNQVVFKPKNMTPDQLLNGTQQAFASFYSPAQTMKRLSRSLRLGISPFFVVAGRNLVATMAARRLQ